MDTTARGFAIREFEDRNGIACSIQKSSVATEDLIWLGPNGAGMHLTRAMAAQIAIDLHSFAATGRLETASGEPARTGRKPRNLRQLLGDLA